MCSLELAKQLKALGVKQDSLFYWVDRGDNALEEYKGIGLIGREVFRQFFAKEYDPIASAYTVAELGEMLPASLRLDSDDVGWFSVKLSVFSKGRASWRVAYDAPRPHDISERAETEADARAMMLIYLLENKIVTVDDLESEAE